MRRWVRSMVLTAAAAAACVPAVGQPSGPTLPPAMQPCTGGYQPPVPRGPQNRWVTAEDYPAAALRMEIESDIAVAISVGTDGRAVDVEITQRSASEALNAATIANIMRRARFLPALQDCQPVVGEFATVIRWRLPSG